jgi:lysophospholipase L1-like esterase
MLFLLISLSLLEGLLFLLVRNPDILKQCPQKIGNMIGYIYVRERPTIQFDPACAQYSATLSYTLKPGSCSFGGQEFMNRYDVNSLGVRDDEDALQHPEIIVAGDTFAMGWGVNHEETFAAQLQKKTDCKVLNAAVSSYGTAREMMILHHVPTDRLKYLIIQYCGNDLDENLEFYGHFNRLPIMTASQYEEYQATYQASRHYFFGKYLWVKIMKRWEEMKQKRMRAVNPKIDKDELDLFLNAIENSGLDLKNVTIIAFVMNGRNPADNKEFPDGLNKKLATGNYPSYLKNMIVLDFSDKLQKEHFYVLDDHLNAGGHKIIADMLAKVVEARQTQ